MKIHIVTQYYPPEIGAPQARLSEMAEFWASAGHDISVFTAFPNHPHGKIPKRYNKKLFVKEIINGVIVYRHWIYATPNEGFVKKTLSHISFMLSLIIFSLRRGDRPDIIIGSSPAFFMMISVYLMGKARNIPYIFEVRDLWPGIFIELGVLRNKYMINALESIEKFLYRNSIHVVTVTKGFADNIIKRGISSSKVSVFTNGVDLEKYYPGPVNNNLYFDLQINPNNYVVLYIGAHGISQGLRVLLDVSKNLEEQKEIVFIFVGEGAEKKQLIEYAKKHNIKNVRFVPGQKKEKVIEYYRLANIILVPLKNIKGFQTFIPSKIFEIMACGKPIIASLAGEAASILEESGASYIVEPENTTELKDAIEDSLLNEEKRISMGISGIKFVARHYNRKIIASNYLSQIRQMIK